MSKLELLSGLLGQRNQIDAEISRLIGRPAFPGHLAECITAEIFGIRLHESATAKASDGVFIDGALADKSVNIKYRSRGNGLLNIAEYVSEITYADYLLAISGSKFKGGSSRGRAFDFAIDSAYVFDFRDLVRVQLKRGVKLGIGSSVLAQAWSAAMIYPDPNNPLLVLTNDQRAMLELFSVPVTSPVADRVERDSGDLHVDAQEPKFR